MEPDLVVKEFEVTVTVRNNKLKRRRLDLGLSQAGLSDASGVPAYAISQYETLYRNPFYATGTWRADVLKLAKFFGVTDPWDLFPASVVDLINKPKTAVRELGEEELAAFAASPELPPTPEEEAEAAERRSLARDLVEQLPERKAFVLKAKNGMLGKEMTLGELADHLGVSKARVQQIEASALRELREICAKRRLAEPSEPEELHESFRVCSRCEHVRLGGRRERFAYRRGCLYTYDGGVALVDQIMYRHKLWLECPKSDMIPYGNRIKAWTTCPLHRIRPDLDIETECIAPNYNNTRIDTQHEVVMEYIEGVEWPPRCRCGEEMEIYIGDPKRMVCRSCGRRKTLDTVQGKWKSH